MMKKSPKFITSCLVIAYLLFPKLNGLAQPSAFSLFASDSVINVILTTDMKLLMKNKFDEQEQSAILQIIRSPGDTITHEVQVKCRGNVRKETCYYPSIRMKLSKQDFSYNKLKWVNVCDGDEDEDYLLKEYLAYKLFKVLTDMSFQTALVRIQYKDTSGKEKVFTSYAFVIQNADELAANFGGRVHEPKILKEEVLNKEQLAIFTFFQYMIGNTDWAFANRHNVEVFTHPPTNSVMPVAYDFDYSGLVNTQYATPHTTIPISHVTVRYNKSICMDEDLCEKTRLLFLEKKEAILSTCREFELLNSKSRAKATDFIEDFFKIIEDRKDAERIFIKDCKQLQ